MLVTWPKPSAFFVPPLAFKYKDVHRLLEQTLLLALDSDRPNPILFYSEHGFGKTLLAATLVKELEAVKKCSIPYVVFDCSEDTREYHLRGTLGITPDGSTEFVPGPFPLAIHLANQTGFAVLGLEELSALTPGAQKMCNPLLDWRNGIYIPALRENIRLNPDSKLLVIATMNPSGYGGVYSLNQDLRSRFNEFQVPRPTEAQERDILVSLFPAAAVGETKLFLSALLRLSQDLRSIQNASYLLSTRDLYLALNNFKLFKEAKQLALLRILDKYEGAERALVRDRMKALFTGVSL